MHIAPTRLTLRVRSSRSLLYYIPSSLPHANRTPYGSIFCLPAFHSLNFSPPRCVIIAPHLCRYVVFHLASRPPSPQASPRLAHPRPICYNPDQYDNLCRLANIKDGTFDDDNCPLQAPQRAHDGWEYLWRRPCMAEWLKTPRTRSLIQHHIRQRCG